MRVLTLALLLFLPGLPVFVSGQIRSGDLVGEWFANNDDSLYFKSDTIDLFSGTNYFQKFTTCRIIIWIVNKQNFDLESLNTCNEPGIITKYIDEEILSLKKISAKQYIEYYRGGIKLDCFEILSYFEENALQYPKDFRTLKLKRIR
jgi:hypothetical protein